MQTIFFGLSSELVLALLTGICTVLAVGIYTYGILKGSTRPYVWAWLVRLGLCSVALLSQIAQGATYSLALTGTQLMSAAVIVGLVLYKHPRMGVLDRLDRSALAIAAVGVGVWMLSGNALYALLGTFVADASATVMGVKESIRRGREESMAFWALAFAAAFMAVVVAGPRGFAIMLAPLFSCLNAMANIGATIFVRQRKRRGYLPGQQELA